WTAHSFQRRCIVDRTNTYSPRLDIADVVEGKSIVNLKKDRALSNRWVLTAVEVSHAPQSALVVGQAGDAAKRQDASGRVIAANDSVLVGEPQRVFRSGKVPGNRN